MKVRGKWWVYILQCSNGHYYCGVSNDLQRRVVQHNNGMGSKYTASRRPVKLMWSKKMNLNSVAQRLECKIKKWSRARKAKLVQGLIDAEL